MVSLLDDPSGFGNQVLSLLGNLVTGGRIGDPSVQRQGPTESGDPLAPVQSPVQRQSTLDALMSFGGALSQAGAGRYGPPVPLGVALNDAWSGARQSAISDEVASQAAIDAQLRRRILQRQELQAEQANAILMQALPGLLGTPQPQPTTPQGPPPGYTPGTSLRGLLGAAEGGDRGYSAVNTGGFTGRYQVGSQLLADQGIYTPAEGEDLRANPWSGTFNIPGFPTVKTRDDFLRTPGAQDAVFDSSMSHLSKALTDNGTFDRGIGKTINGVPVTREGLLAGAWLGGATGIKNWVDSDGKRDPADGNGTKLSQYVALGGRAAPPAAPGAPAPVQVAAPGAPSGATVNYPGRPDQDVPPAAPPGRVQVASLTPTTATDGTTAPAAPAPTQATAPAAAPAAAPAGGGAVGPLPAGASPVMPTSLSYMTQGVVAQLPPAQRALVIAGLLNPKTSGATLLQLATKQPQMPMQIETGAGSYLLSPNGQITQVGGPKGAPTTENFVVQQPDGTPQVRRHEFDPVTRQWVDRGAAPQSEQTQTLQVGGTNVIRHKDAAGNWTTLGLAPIPEGSQPLTDERKQQEIDKLTATGLTVRDGVNPNTGRNEQYFLDPNNHQVHWLGVATPAPPQATRAGAFATKSGEVLGDQMKKVVDAAAPAGDMVQQIRAFRTASQGYASGALSPAMNTVGGFLNSLGLSADRLGVPSLRDDQVVSGEILQKISNGLVKSLIGGVGGFPANTFSDADRRFLERTVPSISNRPDSNAVIMAMLEQSALRVQQKSQAWLRNPDKSDTGFDKFEADWIENQNQNPVFRGTVSGEDANKLPPGSIYRRAIDGKYAVRGE